MGHTRTFVVMSELGLWATEHLGLWWLRQSLVCDVSNRVSVVSIS